MRALQIHAGATARRQLRERGLRPEDVRVIPAAAGGPKLLTYGEAQDAERRARAQAAAARSAEERAAREAAASGTDDSSDAQN